MKTRKMKDSGVEWLGSVPEGWPVERLQWHLEEVAVKNDPVKTTNVLSLTIDRGVIPYSEKGNVGNKSKEDVSQYKIAYPETIVANSMNILIGAVGLSKYEGCVSPVYYVFRARHNACIEFFNYLFQMPAFQKELRRFANGILEIRLRVSADDILKRRLAIPTIPEQRAIAAYLDKRCAKIDAMVADAKKLIEEYKQWKASVIFEAVTGKVDVKSGKLRAKSELRDSGLIWVGLVPKNWQVLPNKYVMTKTKSICEKWEGQPVLSLSMKGVFARDLANPTGKMPTTFDGYQFVEAGNALMCLFDYDVTPRCIGRSFINGVTSPAYSCFRIHDNAILDWVYYYYLMVDNGKEILHLARNLRHAFNEEDFGAIKMPLPPLSEQRAIAAYLDRKCAAIDRVVAEKEGLIADLEQYKKSLIFECVTGKREVA